MLTRRDFLAAAAVVGVSGCERRKPETPLAHLYGEQWVTGAYSHYAQAYADIEQHSERQSSDAYTLLGPARCHGARRAPGPASAVLRAGGSPAATRFVIERDVPERLTFTADMSEEDREAATFSWRLARDNIQRDYDEIRRLDWALTRLISSTGRVRQRHRRRDCWSSSGCAASWTRSTPAPRCPSSCPYKVSRADYQAVLFLLLDRLETDRARSRASSRPW